MIKIAIKNSLIEKESLSQKLEVIEDMPVFHPTEDQFTNPIKYIEQLYAEGVHKYGCIKIVPPKQFKPRLAFNIFSDQKLQSRFQTL